MENNSTGQEIFDYYKEIDGRDGIRVVYWKSGFNYSALNNFGFTFAKGDYILCLNNDVTVITPDWLERMIGQCQRKEVGIVGVKLYYPDDDDPACGRDHRYWAALPGRCLSVWQENAAVILEKQFFSRI